MAPTSAASPSKRVNRRRNGNLHSIARWCEKVGLALRWFARAASAILVPLTALAGAAIVLRVQQYGLTPERITAAAWALVAASYAVGYTFAAVRPGPWMRCLERTNIITAWGILALIATLFTPIADPARLSVADQLHRLDSGRTSPAAFDYAFLRFGAARYGRDGLKGLSQRTGGAINLDVAARSAAALKLDKASKITILKSAEFVSSDVEEDVLWSAQPSLIERARSALQPHSPGTENIYAMAIAGSETQALFSREAHEALRVSGLRFGSASRGSVLLSNGAADLMHSPLATRANVAAMAQAIGERADSLADSPRRILRERSCPGHGISIES